MKLFLTLAASFSHQFALKLPLAVLMEN